MLKIRLGMWPLMTKKRLNQKKIMTTLKSVLLAICLSGCAGLPPAPQAWLCGYTIKFDKFRCVNTVTKEEINLKRDDPKMEASQCLSSDDFKAYANWVSKIKKIAEKRCQ